MSDILNKTKTGTYWSIFLKVLFETIRFGLSVVVARLLNPKDFGLFGIGYMVIFYANSMTNIGFNNALVQKKEITHYHINSVFCFDLGFSVLLTLFCFIGAKSISIFFHAPESEKVLLVLSSLFILTSFYNIPQTILRREIEFKVISIINLIEGLLNYAIAILLAILGFGVWALVYGKIGSILFATILFLIKSRWLPKIEFSFFAFKDLWSFGIWEFLRAQLNYITSYIDYFFIGKFLGVIPLGYYEKAFNISTMPLSFVAPVNTILFSSVSRLQKDIKTVKMLFKKAIITLSVFVFPIYCGLSFISPYFVKVFLGDKWMPMTLSLQILFFAGIFKTLNYIVAGFNVGLGMNKKHTLRRVVSSILLIIFCFIGVFLGIEGVAVAILLDVFITFLLIFDVLKKIVEISFKELIKNLYPAIILSTLMLLCLNVLSNYFPKYTFLNMIILIISGIIVYISLFLILNFRVTSEFKKQIYTSFKTFINISKNYIFHPNHK